MKRIFHPGEEWLYLRLYLGPETAEDWLAVILPELMSVLEEEKLIKKSFFVRYIDPSSHLRVRFELETRDYFGAVIQYFQKHSKDFLDEGLIWNTEIGSYERELERYGNEWIETAEEVFSIDSRFWLGFLSELRIDDDGENKRWQAALLSTDGIFGDFGLPVNESVELLSKMVDTLSSEIGGGKKLRLQIDEKYRYSRLKLEELMHEPGSIEIPGFTRALQLRSDQNRALFSRESIADWDNDLKDRRISDITHMSLNRGFRSKQRMQELVIYTFLKQLYVSALARSA